MLGGLFKRLIVGGLGEFQGLLLRSMHVGFNGGNVASGYVPLRWIHTVRRSLKHKYMLCYLLCPFVQQ